MTAAYEELIHLGLPRTAIPEQPIAMRTDPFVGADEQAVGYLPLFVRDVVQWVPTDRLGRLPQTSPKFLVFAMRARHHRHEATLAGDVAKVLFAGQFAVGHVKEIRTAHQLTQQVPCGAMGRVVHHSATCPPLAC